MPLSLGRTKTGRHRPVDPERDAAPVDQGDRELESYLAALAPDPAGEATQTGFGSSEVHQLRLSAIANEQLRAIAAELGMSPQTLAQEWVMQRLEWEVGRR